MGGGPVPRVPLSATLPESLKLTVIYLIKFSKLYRKEVRWNLVAPKVLEALNGPEL